MIAIESEELSIQALGALTQLAKHEVFLRVMVQIRKAAEIIYDLYDELKVRLAGLFQKIGLPFEEIEKKSNTAMLVAQDFHGLAHDNLPGVDAVTTSLRLQVAQSAFRR